MLIFSEVPNCVSHLSFYSHTVAPQAVLSLKEIMCCSWRWVGAAPNPKDFGLFLAREVRMIQPKMERNSRWREVEVFQVQHHLCLLEEGECALCSFTTSVRVGKISNYLTSAHLHLCNHSTSGHCFLCLLAFCSVRFLIMLTMLPFHTPLLYWNKTFKKTRRFVSVLSYVLTIKWPLFTNNFWSKPQSTIVTSSSM